MAVSNTHFDADGLLRHELRTIERLLALCNDPKTGVSIVPALKVSREAGNHWNRRPIKDPELLKWAGDVQRFLDNGYVAVDETQVVKIDTPKYFRYLVDLILARGGKVELGTHLSGAEVATLRRRGHVVNCLGMSSRAVGGAHGDYYSNYGEVVMLTDCPRDFSYYVVDEEQQVGIMQASDGALYLSGAQRETAKTLE